MFSQKVFWFLDAQTINIRLDAVTELMSNEEVFFDIQSIIGRFLDTDHLLAQCVQIPKQESIKTAEMKINTVIYLKHTLELVVPLKQALSRGQSTLFKAYNKVWFLFVCVTISLVEWKQNLLNSVFSTFTY